MHNLVIDNDVNLPVLRVPFEVVDALPSPEPFRIEAEMDGYSNIQLQIALGLGCEIAVFEHFVEAALDRLTE